VIINFYGGSFTAGSSNDYGPAYLLEKDMVLVNCNYRVGVFGFLSTGDAASSGNWGLKDAAMAVDWVHSYIRNFGGDPKRIVVFGQSAGAALAHLLLLSPAHLKLEEKIKGVMASSGGVFNSWAFENPINAARMAKKFASMNFCPTNKGTQVMVACLRRRPIVGLVALSNVLHVTESSIFNFRPTIEPNIPGAFIADTPENLYLEKKVAKVPLIMSQNSQDTDFLLIRM
jgi:carboxylesterase type B